MIGASGELWELSEGEILAEGVDVAFEGGTAERSNPAEGAGALAGEAFLNGDESEDQAPSLLRIL